MHGSSSHFGDPLPGSPWGAAGSAIAPLGSAAGSARDPWHPPPPCSPSTGGTSPALLPARSPGTGLVPLIPLGTAGCHSKHAWPQAQDSSAEIGDLLLEEGQGLAGTHRDSGDSKGTIIPPRIKYANESPDLHVIHQACS